MTLASAHPCFPLLFLSALGHADCGLWPSAPTLASAMLAVGLVGQTQEGDKKPEIVGVIAVMGLQDFLIENYVVESLRNDSCRSNQCYGIARFPHRQLCC